MQKIGAEVKRKSFSMPKLELPKRTQTSSKLYSGKRTIYKDLISPHQQLKDFKRRLIFTESTHHSFSRLISEERASHLQNNQMNKKGSQYGLSTQVFSDKKGIRNQLSGKQPIFDKKVSLFEALAGQKETAIKNQKEQGKEESQFHQNDEGEFQGYQEGQKIDGDEEYEQEKNKLNPNVKPYSHQILAQKYQTESELKMELLHWKNQRNFVKYQRQDQNFLQMLHRYKLNRKEILKKSIKNSQLLKVASQIRKQIPYTRSSLPKLNRDYQSLSNLPILNRQIPNSEENSPIYVRKDKTLRSLSMKFKKNKKQTKQFNQQIEQQVNSINDIAQGLRRKGVQFQTQILRKGLLNIREIPTYERSDSLPEKRLISNPVYKTHHL